MPRLLPQRNSSHNITLVLIVICIRNYVPRHSPVRMAFLRILRKGIDNLLRGDNYKRYFCLPCEWVLLLTEGANSYR